MKISFTVAQSLWLTYTCRIFWEEIRIGNSFVIMFLVGSVSQVDQVNHFVFISKLDYFVWCIFIVFFRFLEVNKMVSIEFWINPHVSVYLYLRHVPKVVNVLCPSDLSLSIITVQSTFDVPAENVKFFIFYLSISLLFFLFFSFLKKVFVFLSFLIHVLFISVSFHSLYPSCLIQSLELKSWEKGYY